MFVWSCSLRRPWGRHGLDIFVVILAWATTYGGLEQAFSQYGTVTSAKVITDRETGSSKGLGFVEMETGGDDAIFVLNDSELDG